MTTTMKYQKCPIQQLLNKETYMKSCLIWKIFTNRRQTNEKFIPQWIQLGVKNRIMCIRGEQNKDFTKILCDKIQLSKIDFLDNLWRFVTVCKRIKISFFYVTGKSKK